MKFYNLGDQRFETGLDFIKISFLTTTQLLVPKEETHKFRSLGERKNKFRGLLSYIYLSSFDNGCCCRTSCEPFQN